MIVIIDSGSTKADWILLENGVQRESKTTIGFNPITSNSVAFLADYNKNPFHTAAKVQEIFFYGAGCSTAKAIKSVEDTMKSLFPTSQITIQTDLMGAALATSGGKPAIVCILGTGSNSCLFNGQRIIDHIPNLGYILGDEGAGFALGKEILQSFFYREFSDELNLAFQNQYNLSRNSLIKKVYQSIAPNKEIASFAEFAVKHIEHADIKELTDKVFKEFIMRNILKYQASPNIPVHFIGSIAYIFRSRIEKILENNERRVGVFLRKPMEGLIQYHTNQKS